MNNEWWKVRGPGSEFFPAAKTIDAAQVERTASIVLLSSKIELRRHELWRAGFFHGSAFREAVEKRVSELWEEMQANAGQRMAA